jgi:hypothetical protein
MGQITRIHIVGFHVWALFPVDRISASSLAFIARLLPQRPAEITQPLWVQLPVVPLMAENAALLQGICRRDHLTIMS